MNSLKAALLLFVAAATTAAAPPAGLTAFANAVSAMNGYSTSINLFEQKGSATWLATFNYSYAKPNSIDMNIVKGPNAGKDVTWRGGASVTAGKGMFKKNVALTDSLVTSLRGYTVVDLSFPSILSHAQQTAGEMQESTMDLSGKPADVLTLTPANPSDDNGMTREMLFLDPSTHLPIRIDGFTGNTLVRSYTFSSVVAK